jgi:glycosyltransferase involved in cell wall biosynthesis
MAFNGARFLLISNPHAVGHCRRLGFGNGVHLPYLVDDAKYSPGEGRSRREWEMGHGRGFYVLSTARLDDTVKGNAGRLFDELAALVRRNPQVRFVSLAWGRDVERFRQRVEEAGLAEHFLLLSPVGKRRLIDYYRSADCVLDQFVYGYYGATALEAMSVGKPVVMRLREDHYRPLYGGDVAPVLNCQSAAEAAAAIDSLARQPEEARRRGEQARAWLLRHHGRAASVPDLMALLGVTHRGLELPPELRAQNPFHEDPTGAEREYHESCLRPAG